MSEYGLSPEQLRAVAGHIRDRYWQPEDSMSPLDYLVHSAMNAFADGLEAVADERRASSG